MKSPDDSCNGKQKLTQQVAAQIVKRDARGARRSPYKCSYCHCWHLGSSIIPKHERDKRPPRSAYPKYPMTGTEG